MQLYIYYYFIIVHPPCVNFIVNANYAIFSIFRENSKSESSDPTTDDHQSTISDICHIPPIQEHNKLQLNNNSIKCGYVPEKKTFKNALPQVSIYI